MKRIAALTSLLLLCLTVSCAQARQASSAAKPEDAKPSTKLEQFLLKKGNVVIRDTYKLGTIGRTGTALIEALVLTDPNGSGKVKGLRVEVTEAGSYERSNTSFLDVDEAESMVKAIDFMLADAEKRKAQPSDAYTEVTFSTKNDFQVGYFQEAQKDRQSGYVQSGYVAKASCFLPVADLAQLRDMTQKALALLQTK